MTETTLAKAIILKLEIYKKKSHSTLENSKPASEQWRKGLGWFLWIQAEALEVLLPWALSKFLILCISAPSPTTSGWMRVSPPLTMVLELGGLMSIFNKLFSTFSVCDNDELLFPYNYYSIQHRSLNLNPKSSDSPVQDTFDYPSNSSNNNIFWVLTLCQALY